VQPDINLLVPQAQARADAQGQTRSPGAEKPAPAQSVLDGKVHDEAAALEAAKQVYQARRQADARAMQVRGDAVRQLKAAAKPGGLRKDTITPADRAASLKLIAEGRALAKKREQKSAMEKINAARAVAKKILDKAAAKKAKPARARKAFSY